MEDRGRQRRAGAAATRACRAERRAAAPEQLLDGSGLRDSPTGGSGRSPAASSSASRSPGRWRAETPLLLLDEPFAALDALTRERLQEDLRQVSAETGRTSVFVTHSVEEAVFLGSRVVVLTRRPGRVALDLDIDLPRTGVEPDELRALPEYAALRATVSQAVRTAAT